MQIVVSANDSGMRIDVLVARALPHGSRRHAAAALAAGEIRLNGRRASKGTFAAAGDVIEIADDTAATPVLLGNAELEIPVLFEDDVLLAVNKPAGLPSYPLRPTETNTVANFLVTLHPQQATIAARPLEAGLVHRLDTDTSGVLLAARTDAAHADLRRQFRERSVLKRYQALVQGYVGSGGEVCLPLEATGTHSQRMRVARSETGGRAALTRYRPLERFDAHTLVEVEIVTGVMHQIRAHMAEIGHLVAGDTLYGGSPVGSLSRHFLHATVLGIAHPRTQRRLEIVSPLPSDLSDVVALLRQG